MLTQVVLFNNCIKLFAELILLLLLGPKQDSLAINAFTKSGSSGSAGLEISFQYRVHPRIKTSYLFPSEKVKLSSDGGPVNAEKFFEIDYISLYIRTVFLGRFVQQNPLTGLVCFFPNSFAVVRVEGLTQLIPVGQEGVLLSFFIGILAPS